MWINTICTKSYKKKDGWHKKLFKFVTIIMLAINGGFSGIILMSTIMCTKYYNKKDKYLYTEIHLPCVQNLTKKKTLYTKIFNFFTVRVSQTINEN